MNANGSMRMPLLDMAFQLMDSARSPQDFTLVFHLREPPEVESVYEGARSAINRYPVSACCIDGKKWVWRENKYFNLEILSAASETESRPAIERLIDERFDLRRQPPVRQLLVLNGGSGAVLATRFHHAAADGLSAALWLGHQLNVAYRFEAVEKQRAPFVDLPLRTQQTSVRRSQFAFDGACDRLHTSHARRSESRRWLTINFPATDLQQACRRAGGFTYNDLLATCTLEVLSAWNGPGAKIGLWLPMNIRRQANAGFGNGTSRIRLYARYEPGASLVDKCRDVRRQVSWTTRHGEWVVPQLSAFTRVPRPLAGPLLRNYLKLSSVDMATAVFSHAGSWIAGAGEAFKCVERIECVGLLHARQSLALNAATHLGQTWLTFTYDSRRWTADEIQRFARMYEQQIERASADCN